MNKYSKPDKRQTHSSYSRRQEAQFAAPRRPATLSSSDLKRLVMAMVG